MKGLMMTLFGKPDPLVKELLLRDLPRDVAGRELFYRVHWRDCPSFSSENASSAYWDVTEEPCPNCDGSGCKRCGWTGYVPPQRQRGYSCFADPERLVDYFADRGCVLDDEPVVVFTGRRVNQGNDTEPLVVPDMRFVVWLTWGELMARYNRSRVGRMSKAVKRPGSRGGRFWFDEQGAVRYDRPPQQLNLFSNTGTPESVADYNLLTPNASAAKQSRQRGALQDRFGDDYDPRDHQAFIDRYNTEIQQARYAQQLTVFDRAKHASVLEQQARAEAEQCRQEMSAGTNGAKERFDAAFERVGVLAGRTRELNDNAARIRQYAKDLTREKGSVEAALSSLPMTNEAISVSPAGHHYEFSSEDVRAALRETGG